MGGESALDGVQKRREERRNVLPTGRPEEGPADSSWELEWNHCISTAGVLSREGSLPGLCLSFLPPLPVLSQ